MPDIREIIAGPFRHEVVERMREAEYRPSRGINPSALAEGIVNEFSPLYVKHAYETETEPTDLMVVGQYGHTLLLEPELVEQRWAVWDGGVRRGKEWDSFREANEDREIIRAQDVELVCEAVQNALRRQEVVDLIGSGVAEVSVFTEEHGMQCKGRLDWVNTDVSQPLDVKFTADIRPHKFGRVAAALGYTSKLAAYQAWFSRERGVKLKPYKLLVIQLNDRRPHDCCIVTVSEADLHHGWDRCDRMLRRLREAIEKDDWPGIDNGTEVPLHVPLYDMPDEVMFDE